VQRRDRVDELCERRWVERSAEELKGAAVGVKQRFVVLDEPFTRRVQGNAQLK
jgi:hypothetical protein